MDAVRPQQSLVPGLLRLTAMEGTRIKRMKFPAAVRAELGKWRLSPGDKATIMAFCACVGMRMNGDDVEAFVNGARSEKADVATRG